MVALKITNNINVLIKVRHWISDGRLTGLCSTFSKTPFHSFRICSTILRHTRAPSRCPGSPCRKQRLPQRKSEHNRSNVFAPFFIFIYWHNNWQTNDQNTKFWTQTILRLQPSPVKLTLSNGAFSEFYSSSVSGCWVLYSDPLPRCSSDPRGRPVRRSVPAALWRSSSLCCPDAMPARSTTPPVVNTVPPSAPMVRKRTPNQPQYVRQRH